MAETPDYKAHLFICTNLKENKLCCASKNAADMRDRLKKRLQSDPALKGKVRVNASGCLGECKNGIAAVLYPQGRWFLDLSEKDEDVLFAAVHAAVKDTP